MLSLILVSILYMLANIVYVSISLCACGVLYGAEKIKASRFAYARNERPRHIARVRVL